ncbi:MAG: translation initiation factor IF-2 [Candidatus Coatesbacteria bacterium]|nr:MAG: translation initiation factor IF-2 [Candidatus Coatesbacteria bacterium]
MAAKRRVHEIAKSLDRTSKEVIALLNKVGFEVKAANSVVTPEAEAQLRAHLFGIKGKEPEAEPSVMPDLVKPSLGKARLRKKAPRKAEEEVPAEPGAPPTGVVEAPAEGAEAPAVAAEPGAAAAAEGAPGEESAEAAPTEAVAEAAPPAEGAEPAVAEPQAEEEVAEAGAKPAKGKKPPRAEKAEAGATLGAEIEEDSAARISSEALRRLAKSDRLSRPRGRPGRRREKPTRARRGAEKGRGAGQRTVAPPEPKVPPKKKVRLRGERTLGELALELDVPTEKLQDFYKGQDRRETTMLSLLGMEEQAAAARELGFDVDAEATAGEPEPRRPVVAVLGHVDHGKTTLLDALRKTDVVATESGGITQHVGASLVESSFGDVVFIDTPGHEVFTEMRSRGAQVTDLVVLVVAADDGVMPQTLESISHAKAAHVPIVVAITKMDKPEADPLRVKRGLAEHGVTTEDWGGEVLAVEVSAPRGEGLDKVLEAISLQAEIMELTADPKGRAAGVVLESTLDRGRGAVVTVLVGQGTLRIGDSFVAGKRAGRVRALFDTAGKKIKQAGPSTPVQILGAEGLPDAGDVWVAMPDDKTARSLAALLSVEPEKEEAVEPAFSLDDWYRQLQEGGKAELNLVLKADVAGSLEALVEHLGPLGDEEVATKILHTGVGPVNESDVLLASASEAVIIAFRVGVEAKAKKLAQQEGVEIRTYDVIYETIEDVRAALEGLLEPEIVTEVVGEAEVRQVFPLSASAKVAGCMVQSGRVFRGARARVLREEAAIHEGTVTSLRRFRDDVREVQQGLECGIVIGGFPEVEEGDVIQVLEDRKIARRLPRK